MHKFIERSFEILVTIVIWAAFFGWLMTPPGARAADEPALQPTMPANPTTCASSQVVTDAVSRLGTPSSISVKGENQFSFLWVLAEGRVYLFVAQRVLTNRTICRTRFYLPESNTHYHLPDQTLLEV